MAIACPITGGRLQIRAATFHAPARPRIPTGTPNNDDGIGARALNQDIASTFVPVADLVSTARSLAQLPHCESQPVLDITGLLEASVQKGPDPLLCGGSPDRSDASLPARRDLDVGWQARRIHQALRIGDGPLVERGD